MIGSALIFLLSFVNKYSKFKFFIVATLSLFFFFLSFTKLIVANVEKVFQTGYVASTGPLFILYALFLSISLCIHIVLLAQYYKKNIGKIRYQSKYLLIGVGLFGFFSTLVSFILPLFGNWGYASLDSVSSLAFVVLTFYAITKHRLMGIRLAVKKFSVYFASLIGVMLMGFTLYLLGNLIFNSNIPFRWFGPFVLFVGVVVFDPLKKFLEGFASRYLFTSLYDTEKTIQQLTKSLASTIHLNEVTKTIVGVVSDTMKPEKIGVMLRRNTNESTASYIAAHVVNFEEKREIPLVENTFLNTYLQKTKRPLVYDELSMITGLSQREKQQLTKVTKEMKDNAVAIALPLIAKSQLVGIILLGNKISHDAYTKEDFKLFEIVSSQAAIAIENAILYNNMKEVVDQQTSDIRAKTERLQELLKLRSEFLDIASHQLRTPVSVINGTISMIREGDIEKLPPEQQKKFFNNIFLKGKKLESIISDILAASEMDKEFKITHDEKIDVPALVERVTKSYAFDAEEKKLQLTYKPPPTPIAPIPGNEKYLEQMIDNLLSNALHYTEKGSITVSLQKKEKDCILLSIADTGIGIPEKDRARLFDKFVRGGNARNIYTDGSGLGLFIIKKIVDAHPGGKVWMESQEGKGTTFFVQLCQSVITK